MDVNPVKHPELFGILRHGETISTLRSLTTDGILLRWLNFHAEKNGYQQEVQDFGEHLKDGKVYVQLLNQLAPESCSLHLLGNLFYCKLIIRSFTYGKGWGY